MSLLANGSTKRRVTTCAQCFVCHKTLQDIGVHFKDTHAEVEVPFHILNEWGYDQCADCGILVRPGALAMHISHLRRKNLPDNHKIRTPPRLGVLPATASTTQLMPIPTMTLGGTPGAAPGAPREPRAGTHAFAKPPRRPIYRRAGSECSPGGHGPCDCAGRERTSEQHG